MKKLLLLSLAILMILCCLASCDCFTKESDHEHTWEYVQYETGHFKQYTCGCPSPDIMGEHYDNDSNDICDACGYDMSSRAAGILSNLSGCEWFNEINPLDIARIDMISGGGGPLPPISKTYISSSTDKAVISSIFEEYYLLDVKPVSKEQTQIPDGGYFTVDFILNDGSVKSISFINGDFYHDGNGNYYEISHLPVFRDGTNFTCCFGFETWEKESSVYLYDGSLVAVIPTAELRFVELTDDIELGDKAPTHYIEMRGERINFLSECYFYIGDDRSTYYQLIGKNLDEIIDEYNGKYSVTMNDEDWLYEDLKPKYKAGEEVSVKLMIPYDLGFLLFVNEERVMYEESSNYNYCEFIFTMPECDVVVDVKTYDGFLPHYNYAVLIETFWEGIPEADSVSVIHYYGEFSSGAIAAMMSCSEYDYTEALWDEVIDGVVIHYSNGNRIIVLYEGEFYNLTTAYENGYITKDDLQDICDLHNQFLGWIEEE